MMVTKWLFNLEFLRFFIKRILGVQYPTVSDIKVGPQVWDLYMLTSMRLIELTQMGNIDMHKPLVLSPVYQRLIYGFGSCVWATHMNRIPNLWVFRETFNSLVFFLGVEGNDMMHAESWFFIQIQLVHAISIKLEEITRVGVEGGEGKGASILVND